MATSTPAGGFKFNSFDEIKSHSSILYNERMAILFYLLDMKAILMNTNYMINDMLEVRAIIKQIYKNIRMLLRNNPIVRATLNLDTKDQGIYVTDVAIGIVDKMIEHCQENGWSTKKIYIIAQELNNFETMLKDILQYFHYFIRPDFRQKPDIEIATLKYKDIADTRTVEELKEIVGKNHHIDFERLGANRIELPQIEEQETQENQEEQTKEEDEWDIGGEEEDESGSNPESDGNYDSKEWE